LSQRKACGHDADLLFYRTEEAREGRDAFTAKCRPEFAKR
jgi:naphthoate synthase